MTMLPHSQTGKTIDPAFWYHRQVITARAEAVWEGGLPGDGHAAGGVTERCAEAEEAQET